MAKKDEVLVSHCKHCKAPFTNKRTEKSGEFCTAKCEELENNKEKI